MNLLERVRIAYKKLKANVYPDKTQLPLQNRIVFFENDKKASALKRVSHEIAS